MVHCCLVAVSSTCSESPQLLAVTVSPVHIVFLFVGRFSEVMLLAMTICFMDREIPLLKASVHRRKLGVLGNYTFDGFRHELDSYYQILSCK